MRQSDLRATRSSRTSARQLGHTARLVISELMNWSHKFTTFENRSAVMKSAAPSGAPAPCMPSVIPISWWSGLRRRFQPSNSDSSSATLPHSNRACSRSMPARSGLKLPPPNPRPLMADAKSKSPMSNVLFKLPAPPTSINCATRSCLNRNARAAPLNSPFDARVRRDRSFRTTANTACPCNFQVRCGSRRSETCLPVQCRPEGWGDDPNTADPSSPTPRRNPKLRRGRVPCLY